MFYNKAEKQKHSFRQKMSSVDLHSTVNITTDSNYSLRPFVQKTVEKTIQEKRTRTTAMTDSQMRYVYSDSVVLAIILYVLCS